MKYARLNDHTVIEVIDIPAGTLEDRYHPTIAAQFSAVPDDVVVGSVVDNNGDWTHPVPSEDPPSSPAQIVREISPAEFILLFDPSELVLIKASSNDAVKIYWEMIYDKGLIKSINVSNPLLDSILALFVAQAVITSERSSAIKGAAIYLASNPS